MAILDRVPAKILAARLIASVDPALAQAFGLGQQHQSVAVFTCDFDDVGYVACDEATKMAAVDVVYAASFYAGSTHGSGPFSGEFMGVLAASTPADALAGLRAAQDCMRGGVAFQHAADDGPLFFAQVITSLGTYLSAEAGVEVGSSLAYLIAPPLEATFALDAALKAAPVRMVKHVPPPSPTNFSGGMLAGPQAACQAACEAFTQAVLAVAAAPLGELDEGLQTGYALPRHARGGRS